ncbi:MAG: DNA alkylation repair protein [Fusobacterium sp.]|nr:DNA alkylation repair protein [Fusobacterium sp.]
MPCNELREWLLQEAEPKYRDFSAALVPNCGNMLGVRIPKMRAKAKQLAKGDWRAIVKSRNCEYFEEILMQGFVIGCLKLPCDEHLALVRDYVPKITNWSLCDCFCAGLKFVQKNRDSVWEFLQPYLASKDEFELRFGVVMLLDHFIVDEWIDKVLDTLFSLDSEDYYAQMGIAWAISVCMVKFFDKTVEYLKQGRLSPVIFKKSIQKGCESLRLTKEQKKLLRTI